MVVIFLYNSRYSVKTRLMEAFVLAAGLGTRLRPLTNDRPKALVEVDGRSLLEINLHKIIQLGASRIVVNVHHFGNKVIDFVNSRKWDCEIVVSDERGLLLDTGGGLKKAQQLFKGDGPILIHNVDILSRIDLADMIRRHAASGDLATLAVSDRKTSRYLLFDNNSKLVGWHNTGTDEHLWAGEPREEYKPLAFSGIAVISPKLANLLPEADRPYSIIPEYIKIARDHPIGNYEHSSSDWIDVGRPETLAKSTQFTDR